MKIKRILLTLLFFTLTACDNPATKLNNFKPESFKLTFTKGGLLLVSGQQYKETDNYLSKLTASEVLTKKGELSYKAIYSFLKIITVTIHFLTILIFLINMSLLLK